MRLERTRRKLDAAAMAEGEELGSNILHSDSQKQTHAPQQNDVHGGSDYSITLSARAVKSNSVACNAIHRRIIDPRDREDLPEKVRMS
jgi:hypothetical protein